jgi:hypothetical protein
MPLAFLLVMIALYMSPGMSKTVISTRRGEICLVISGSFERFLTSLLSVRNDTVGTFGTPSQMFRKQADSTGQGICTRFKQARRSSFIRANGPSGAIFIPEGCRQWMLRFPQEEAPLLDPIL